ncbi:acyl carrier protein [Reyranella sp.]|uniref:acyl carrier protein n=1 Tax=Reyranella sp. TaxID=1929291 RepID=UPI003F6F2B64
MSSEAVMERLRAVIAQQFNCLPDQIDSLTVANDILGWDSLSHAILLLKIEDAFDIEFPEDDMFAVRNVGDLAALLQRLLR